jgi:fibronectin-binding autotransporter adhesin
LTLTNAASSFSGNITVLGSGTFQNSRINFSSIGNYGANSSLGTGGGNATITISQNGLLNYTGTADSSSNRKISFAAGNFSSLGHSGGSGVLSLSNVELTSDSNSFLTQVAAGGTIHLSGNITRPSVVNTVKFTAGFGGGSGTTILSGVNNFAGVVSLQGGVLQINSVANGGVASAWGAGSATATNLDFRNGTTLRYVGSGHSTDRLFSLAGSNVNFTIESSGSGALNFTGTGNLSLSTLAKVLRFGGTNTDMNTFTPIIDDGTSGTTSVQKNDGGTWALAGNNTYTGTTSVNAGTLLINGNQSSANGNISVAAGATLGGNGTMGGGITSTTLTSVFDPGVGTTAGKLTINGAGNFASGATFKMDLGAVTTPGTTYDQLAIGGLLTGSTAALGMQFDFSNLGGAQTGVAYTILTFGSSTGFAVSDLAMINSSGFILDTNFGSNGWQINADSLQVQFAAIPEPSTWALIAISLTAAMVLRRRRLS